MPSRLICAILLLTTVLGQGRTTLQRLLGLSDEQVAEIRQKKPPGRMAMDVGARRLVLSESQISKVVAVARSWTIATPLPFGLDSDS